jgi:hypothetical protein
VALQPFVGPWPLLQFRNLFTQTVRLLGRVISPSQGRYLHTGQYKRRINAHTDIHASSGIRTPDPCVRTSEDSSCLRPLSYLKISLPFTRSRDPLQYSQKSSIVLSSELSWIQSTPVLRIYYWRICILPCSICLCIPSGLFPLGHSSEIVYRKSDKYQNPL